MKKEFKNKYEHFKINFIGLEFEIKLIDDDSLFPNTKDTSKHHEFKVIIKGKDKEITYKFYNSVMDKEITDILNLYKKDNSFNGFLKAKQHLKQSVLKMWGGYDKDLKNYWDLDKARQRNLFYSIINDLSSNLNDDFSSYSWFCSNYGYDEDLIISQKIFNSCVELQNKLLSLNLDEKQLKYLREQAQQETDKFSKDINELFN